MLYYFVLIFSFFVFPLSSESEKKPQDLNVLENIQKILSEHIAQHQIPGMAVNLHYNEKEYFIFFGFSDSEKKQSVNPGTLFRLASITKVFTSTLLALQFAEGKLQLTDSVSKFLKFKNNEITKNGIDKVLLVNLATHTSSLPRMLPSNMRLKNKGIQTEMEVIDYLNTWTPNTPIGTKFLYSNLGFAVLGMAITAESKTSYSVLLTKEILQPLKMTNTFIVASDDQLKMIATGYNKKGPVVLNRAHIETPGSGALFSNIADMSKFLKMNLGIDSPKNLIFAAEYAQKEFFKVNKEQSAGLGWTRIKKQDGPVIIEKNGGLPGFSSYIGLTKDPKKVGIVLLINKESVKVAELGRKLLLELQK